MSLKGQIQEDTRGAMKAGEKDRLKVLRLMSAAIKQVEIDERRELDDAAVLGILNKMVKQRRDSIAQYVQGKRQDLADIETAEIAIIEGYLPEQMSGAELGAIIDDAIAETRAESIRDMGKVMAIVKVKAAGRADMGAVGATVKARLG
ncbi:MAG: GatB/YqeY domain-containing protein [Gammaproteobacteria bacterium]|nr:GatB/YqeY domain-containing protein [Gammaproteobacteria bacterium]MDH5344465.1 GatB/YqeY domain-containing protein [Gammaproteobacteria bacterium]